MGVKENYPATGDLWPDWENELRVDLGEAMEKVGLTPTPQEQNER